MTLVGTRNGKTLGTTQRAFLDMPQTMEATCHIIVWCLITLLWLVSGLPDLDGCRPDVCYPCFSTDIKCDIFKLNDTVVPQYLDENITSLNVTFQGSDNSTARLQLKDIRRYRRLESLGLYWRFSSIDSDALSSSSHLSTLKLSDTLVTELPDGLMSSCTGVTSLILDKNRFRTIPINIFRNSSGNSVKSFQFSNQERAELPCGSDGMMLPDAFRQLEKLQKLDLGYSTFSSPNCSPRISEQFFEPVANITNLFLCSTDLLNGTERALRRLRRLETLEICSMLPYMNCPSAAGVLFDNLPDTITNLNVHYWETQEPLTDECRMTQSRTLQHLGFMKIRMLSFGYSGGMFGSVLLKGVIPPIATLEQLDLSSCELYAIEKDVFTDFPRLWKLTLSGNPLGSKDLPFLNYPHSTISHLSLVQTDIRSDDGFQYHASHLLCSLPNLVSIEFNSNWLNRLPIFDSTPTCNFTTSEKVTMLTFIHNRIKHFSDIYNDSSTNICLAFPNLRYLKLRNNFLKNVVGLQWCANLQHLDVGENQLSYGQSHKQSNLTDSFQHLTKMETLNMDGNNFHRLDDSLISAMVLLQEFSFRQNELQEIGSKAFQNNRLLKVVDLSYNYIESVDPQLFRGLVQLRILKISDNKLVSLDQLVLNTIDSLPHLHEFNIQDNPFDCDCDRGALQDWLHTRTKFVEPAIQFMSCSTPKRVAGQYVYFYKNDIYQCYVVKFLIFGGTILAAFLVTLAIALPCYKYRWYVKHARIVWRAFKASLENVQLEQVLPYDAYVSFDSSSEEDSAWVAEELVPEVEDCSKEASSDNALVEGSSNKKQLRLYVEHRDSLGGTNRFTEREITLQKSKRIIIVVSCSYLKSAECLGEADLSGLQMHGTEFYQPNRILLLIREDLSEEIIRPPMSSLLLGRTLKVETNPRKKEAMWNEIRSFLSKPLYVYGKPDELKKWAESNGGNHSDPEEGSSETTPLLSTQG